MQSMRKIVAFLPLFFVLTACTNPLSSGPKPTPVNNEEVKAVEAARKLYQDRVDHDADYPKKLANGPCLAGEIIPDWSADIAHQPRIATDDDPRNQCTEYREGKTHHFVELDEDGNFLRAY